MVMKQPKETKDEKVQRESRERFLRYDQQKMIDIFHLRHDDDNLYITFIGQEFRIERATGNMWQGQRPADTDEMASIFELLTKSEIAPQMTGTWKSVAELCENTTDTSLTRYDERLKPFEGHMEALAAACEKLGGLRKSAGDVSYIIPLFEGVDVWFQCWDKDDEFPLSVQFLWDASIVLHFRWSILWNVMSCVTKRLLEDQ